MKKLVFLILIVFHTGFNFAQEITRDSTIYLEEVILLDPSLRKGLGLTDAQTLGVNSLKTYGPVAAAAVLNQVAGVNVLSGALNTNRITIRGVGSRTPFGTDKIRLYFQNIPVTNGTGFSTIEAFDLENLYAVNIVKGPKATAYGAVLGGAILLGVPDGEAVKDQLRYNFTAGSYGLIKNNLGLQIKESNLAINLAVNQLSSEGYRENNAFYRKGVLLNMTYKFSPNQRLKFLGNYIDYNAQIPSSLSLEDFREDPRQAAANWKAARGFEANKYSLFGITHELDLSSTKELANTIFYSYLDHYEPRPFNILDEYTNTFGFRSVLSSGTGKDFISYYLGMELLKDEYTWQTYENRYRENDDMGSLKGIQLSDNKEFRRQFFAFGTLQYTLSQNFKIQTGLQVNRTVYDFRDLFNQGPGNKNARREFDWLFLPSLDIRYSPKNSLLLYANLSRGFSNPSLEETLTPQGVINPGIDQETGIQIETGANWTAVRNLSIDLSLFHMAIKNLLVAERVGEDQFIGRNAGSTRFNGLELTGQYSMPLSETASVIARLAYTHNRHRFKEFIDGEEDYSGNELTGVPKDRLNARAELRVSDRFMWQTSFDYTGPIPITDANSIYSEAFYLFSSRVQYKTVLHSGLVMEFNAGIQNIFNRNYAQSVLINASGFGGADPRFYYPGNGRNFYTGVSFKWL